MTEEQHSPSDTIRSDRTYVNNKLVIDYTLYHGKADGRVFYSIEATISHSGETALVYDITGDPDKAEYIFSLIARGGVTPCCIFEIIEDIIESMSQELPPQKDHFPAET